jgi:hypothetical protein
MRRVNCAFVLAVAVAAGGSIAAPAPAAASCALVVVWHDTAYFESVASVPGPSPGRALAGAVAPGCNDTGGDPPPPTWVGAHAIVGISPAAALLYGHRILVAPGYFPPVRQSASCRVGRPLTLLARVHPAAGFLTIDASSGNQPVFVYVDAHTHITGLSRHGLPYIGDRQRVRIDAVHCGSELLARRIVPAGRIVPETTAEDILGADWRGGPSIETSARRHGWWVVAAAAVTAAIACGLLILRSRPGAARRG